MAGFYDTRVLPWILHLTMKNPEVTRRRQRVVPAARGRVLEVGFGSGLNLAFYSAEVESVVGIDPSAELHRIAAKGIAAARVPVEFVNGPAEDMPFEDGRFDSVLVTWSLCTIAEPMRALAEMRRVLKPTGGLVFVEHGRAPDAGVEAWQRRLNPLWRRMAGGCNMDRRIDALIGDSGFAMERLETGYLDKGPRILTYTYEGTARRR